jgi:ABC-type glutathione transport system ATPase component
VSVFEVQDLTVRFASSRHRRAVEGVSFAIGGGEIVGVSGPSGCGKSTMALAIMGLLPSDVDVSGEIRLRGRDLRACSERQLAAVRGAGIGIIFQESALALNPLLTVGGQITEIVRAHDTCDRETARHRALAALDEAGLGALRSRAFDSYPHELSGGQRQRVLIAQALIARPALVIADEPTASLDAEARADVLDLIRRLSARQGTAFLLISHSADVLTSTAHRVIEMRDGRVVEPQTRHGFGSHFTARVRHDSRPHFSAAPIIEVIGAKKTHAQRRLLSTRHRVAALNGVDLQIERGQTIGLMGPSGCGKSTLARCIAGLDTLDAGEIRFDGRLVSDRHGHDRQRYRNQVQLIFQDSAAALNPRFTALDVITEPMVVQGVGTGGERRSRAIELMQLVGLDAERLHMHPNEFSGGERQRLAIARALSLSPRVLIFDEAFSGLDADARRRLIGLLQDLQATHGLTYLCISHDRDLLAEFASEIVVMHDGHVERSAVPVDDALVPMRVPA